MQKNSERDIRLFAHGFHTCGRLYGIYLWDVNFDELVPEERKRIVELSKNTIGMLGLHSNSRPVAAYDRVTGNEVLRFHSITAAAKYLNPKNVAAGIRKISFCCRGIQKKAFDYHWKYVEKSKIDA